MAFKDLYRILKKARKTYVGGGKGTPEVKRQIEENMILIVLFIK